MNQVTRFSWKEIWASYCPDLNREELDLCDWLQSSVQSPDEIGNPVEFCDWLGRLYSSCADEDHRKTYGQFFTPPEIARFMAKWSNPLDSNCEVVDPGAGMGILVAAIAEHIAAEGICQQWKAIVYEIDTKLRPALTLALGYIRDWLHKQNILFEFQIRAEDFILANAFALRPTLLADATQKEISPHLVIANPPYFKVSRADPRAILLEEVIHGQPNIYALFMASAAKLLRVNGQLIFITPRSFSSGPYFQRFRKWFFGTMALEHLHLFESRTDTFARDKVLQENLILAATKTPASKDFVQISNSHGIEDLMSAPTRQVPFVQVIDFTSPEAMLNVPKGASDEKIREVFSQWNDRLHTFGINISTGPIVPFRTTALTTEAHNVETAPVLWIQHIRRMAVDWPSAYFDKPQCIRVEESTRALLLPNTNYVFIRRFSPKEENSRITAAPYLKGDLQSRLLGIENHINFLYRPNGSLSASEAFGLAAFLNSRWVDQYFRLSSGNTQVSATELRNLPLPPLEKIKCIGEQLMQSGGISRVALLNQIVDEELNMPFEISTIGGHMSKIEEAKALLNALGLPPAQRNELAALTLLALAGLTENDAWNKTQRHSIRIHDMILFIEKNYKRRYAENTRETFRRQVLHQFEQARLVDRNPDDPTLPTNSPRTHYAISEAVLPVIQNYGTKSGQQYLEKFVKEQGTLLELYQQLRTRHLIPLKDATGQAYHLSPGKHNQLQVIVIEKFAPRFASDAKILYLGDTANKTLIMDDAGLRRIGFPTDKHNKLPDIVFFSKKKNWLFLIEVVTSHGPVSPKRYRELENLFDQGSPDRVYVSVFYDFKEYLRHARNIAWETEIWISEAPDHLIHYNGDKFIGPRTIRHKKK